MEREIPLREIASRATLKVLDDRIDRMRGALLDHAQQNLDPPVHFKGCYRDVMALNLKAAELEREREDGRLHDIRHVASRDHSQAADRERSGGPDHPRRDGPEWDREPV